MKKYEYAGISPAEILENERGTLKFEQRQGVGEYQQRVDQRQHNKKLILKYMNEVGQNGWEFVGVIEYQLLPYRGMLVFRREIEEEAGNEEEILRDSMLEAHKISEDEIKEAFKEENPDKHILWRGKITDQYKEFKKDYLDNLE